MLLDMTTTTYHPSEIRDADLPAGLYQLWHNHDGDWTPFGEILNAAGMKYRALDLGAACYEARGPFGDLEIRKVG